MSKHFGNILEPIPLMDQHGADAVRWFMACSGSPWMARRVGHSTIAETVRKVLLTYWNTVAFQSLYARASGWEPGAAVPAATDRHVLDRWLVSATNELIRDVTVALDDFDTQKAGALLASFVDDLSNWYVRRSRRRFWAGEAGALVTLHETLDVVTRLMAPIMPFVTERVWQDLFAATDPTGPESVHLASWPVADESLIDAGLMGAMATARRIVELGRAARAESRMKVRQVLKRMLVPTAALAELTAELIAEVRSELNVQDIASFTSAGDLVDHTAKGNFRALGKRFGKLTPKVAAAIAAADASRLVRELRERGRSLIDLDGESLEVSADEVLLTERPRDGWSVVNEQGETVALDLELTPELVRAGRAREVIRVVQEARKSAGLDVSDRILLRLAAGAELLEAIREHADLISDEVLAVDLQYGDVEDPTAEEPELGLTVKITKA